MVKKDKKIKVRKDPSKVKEKTDKEKDKDKKEKSLKRKEYREKRKEKESKRPKEDKKLKESKKNKEDSKKDRKEKKKQLIEDAINKLYESPAPVESFMPPVIPNPVELSLPDPISPASKLSIFKKTNKLAPIPENPNLSQLTDMSADISGIISSPSLIETPTERPPGGRKRKHPARDDETPTKSSRGKKKQPVAPLSFNSGNSVSLMDDISSHESGFNSQGSILSQALNHTYDKRPLTPNINLHQFNNDFNSPTSSDNLNNFPYTPPAPTTPGSNIPPMMSSKEISPLRASAPVNVDSPELSSLISESIVDSSDIDKVGVLILKFFHFFLCLFYRHYRCSLAWRSL